MRRSEEPLIFEVCHDFKTHKVTNSCTCPSAECIPPEALKIAKVDFGLHKFRCTNCDKCGTLYVDKKNKNRIIKGKCDEC